MAADLYDQLCDLELLRRAWHLARNDSRTHFMHDPFRYSDFGVRLDDHLMGVKRALGRGAFRPRPPMTIDVPKSNLSVRPGSVLEIEDLIVLFAIAWLIAPKLDRRLPEGVHSWRVKTKPKRDRLFTDHEILKVPFLKGRTIRRRISIVEPWYQAWPRFIEELDFAYENEGYSHLVVSDIVSYFENIDLSLLRDVILRHLPNQQRIVNFLIELLECLTWPCIEGASVGRGIPQGNGVSSFIGNVYLLPLDEAFESFKRANDIKYLRYMDDIKILAKDEGTARRSLFLMNEELRRLRLNIQGSKTRIISGKEIRDEFFDARLEAVNDVISGIQKCRELDAEKKNEYASRLGKQLREVRRGALEGRDLRLYRRLLTGFTLLRHSKMVRRTLDELQRNPDARLLNSAVRYLRLQRRNRGTIAKAILEILRGNQTLFAYQEANLFMIMRYMRSIPREVWGLAKNRVRVLKTPKHHWYIKQQAALLLSLKKLTKKELSWVRRVYEEEQDVEVKRAWVKALAQLSRSEFEDVTRELVFAIEPKLQRLGRLCHMMLYSEEEAVRQVEGVFREFDEDRLVDRLWELQVLAMSRHGEVCRVLLKSLRSNAARIKRPTIKQMIEAICESLRPRATAVPRGVGDE